MSFRQFTVVFSSVLLLFQIQTALAGAKKQDTNQEINIAIIGGGLSGLTAAYRLAKLNDEFSSLNLHLKINVYEARKRLGGRVFTVMMNHDPIEMGGQYLEDGGDANEIRQLIQELGLKTITYSRPTLTHYFYERGNEKGSHPGRNIKIYEEVWPKIERISSDKDQKALVKFLKVLEQKHSTMESVLEEFFESKRKKALSEKNLQRANAYTILKDYYRVRIMTYESLPPSKLASTYATGSFLHFLLRTEAQYLKILETQKKDPKSGESDTSPYVATSVEGGNGRLVQALGENVESLHGEIHYEMPLTELKRDSDESYTLKFKNGQTTHADIVVLTIPAPVYKKVKFAGNPIPENQLSEIQKIPYGPVGKIQIPVQSRRPSDMIGSVFTSDMLTWFNRDSVRDQNNPNSVVTFYFTGNGKILKIPFDQLTPHAEGPKSEAWRRLKVEINALKTAYPNLSVNEDGKDLIVQGPLEKQLASYSSPLGMNWALEEYSLGGYSAFAPEQASLFSPDQLKDSLGRKVYTLFEPVLPNGEAGKCDYCGLYFAGEHTATQGTPATMEGAVHSGNKVGHQIPVRLKAVKSKLHVKQLETVSE